MHLLFLTHYFPPEGNAPAARVYEMCRQWVAQGHRVTVVTCAPNVPSGQVYEGYRNRWSQREQVDGIEVIRVWTYLAANQGKWRRMANFISYMMMAFWRSLFVRDVDLVIATSPQFFCGLAGRWVKAIKRVPMILEVRDLWPESIVAVGAMRSSKMIRFLEGLEKRLYRAADHMVTVGRGYRQRLIEKGVPEQKISIIMNGVDFEKFDQPNDQLPVPLNDESSKLSGKWIVTYSGTIGMACGLEVVIETAAILESQGDHSVTWRLVGDGAERARLEKMVEKRQLTTVRLLGRVPREQVPGYLAMSDACLVHLKKCDLFKTVLPSKMFEAMAMTKPVLLGVEGDAARVLTESKGGVCFQPGDADSLIKAVKQLQQATANSQAMGDAGRRYVQAHHDRAQLAKQYLEIIKKTLGQATVLNEVAVEGRLKASLQTSSSNLSYRKVG